MQFRVMHTLYWTLMHVSELYHNYYWHVNPWFSSNITKHDFKSKLTTSLSTLWHKLQFVTLWFQGKSGFCEALLEEYSVLSVLLLLHISVHVTKLWQPCLSNKHSLLLETGSPQKMWRHNVKTLPSRLCPCGESEAPCWRGWHFMVQQHYCSAGPQKPLDFSAREEKRPRRETEAEKGSWMLSKVISTQR